MTNVSEAAAACAGYLGLDTLLKALKDNTTLSQSDADCLDDILQCMNIVAGDIAVYVMPLTKSKPITVVNGTSYYSQIAPDLCEVLSLRDKAGNNVSFTPYSDRITADDGSYTVCYSYLPTSLQMNSVLPFPKGMSDKLLVYGTVAEFCLLHGRNNDAVAFNDLFYKEIDKYETRKSAKPRACSARRWL